LKQIRYKKISEKGLVQDMYQRVGQFISKNLYSKYSQRLFWQLVNKLNELNQIKQTMNSIKLHIILEEKIYIT
jgi:transcriptional regulator CtsR